MILKLIFIYNFFLGYFLTNEISWGKTGHRVVGEVASKYISKKGSFVCASDGFFPFKDSINLLHKHGCSIVAQPSGSINDSEIISFSLTNKISLYFTKNRLFKKKWSESNRLASGYLNPIRQ